MNIPKEVFLTILAFGAFVGCSRTATSLGEQPTSSYELGAVASLQEAVEKMKAEGSQIRAQATMNCNQYPNKGVEIIMSAHTPEGKALPIPNKKFTCRTGGEAEEIKLVSRQSLVRR